MLFISKITMKSISLKLDWVGAAQDLTNETLCSLGEQFLSINRLDGERNLLLFEVETHERYYSLKIFELLNETNLS